MGNVALDYLKNKERNSLWISFADPILITHCGDRRLLEKMIKKLINKSKNQGIHYDQKDK